VTWPWLSYPQAITGTWSDLERRAKYLYENGAEGNDTHDLAEAVLVLLRTEYEKGAHRHAV
jgi:hypothetical protein